jgi:glucose-specific phosphotransferase system IIA component
VGEGIAIVPFERKLYAPCDGYVTYIHEAKHAMFIRTMQNIEVLLHVGIDTVELKGKGFDIHVCENEKIICGQLLWEVNFDLLKSRGKAVDIIVCIPRNENLEAVEFIVKNGKVKAVENLLLRCKFKRGEENA